MPASTTSCCATRAWCISDEPFTRLLTQGMVLKDGAKMSKSKGNTVDPQSLIDRYGADTVRLFSMFAAPPEQSLEWSDAGVEGANRFLKRLWKLGTTHTAPGAARHWTRSTEDSKKPCAAKLHETIAKVSDDYGRRQTFNTAIAAVMELCNELGRLGSEDNDRAIMDEALRGIVLMLSPIVPHICHTLWRALGESSDILGQQWPAVDESALSRDSIELVIQVKGKVRGKVSVSADADDATIQQAALAQDNVSRFVEELGDYAMKIVPGKLVSIFPRKK